MLDTLFYSSRVAASEDRLPVTLVTLFVFTPAFAAFRLAAPPATPLELRFYPHTCRGTTACQTLAARAFARGLRGRHEEVGHRGHCALVLAHMCR